MLPRALKTSPLTQAREAMGRVRGVLVYKDEDELDTGMQKVQPLPFLGEPSSCELS